MKNLFLILLALTALLVLPAVSAEIHFYKDNFEKLETIQAEIVFDALAKDIALENIKITDMQGNRQNVQINLLKITHSHYFLFFSLGNEGNYLLKAENLVYREDNILKQTSLGKNFQVVASQKNITVFPAVFRYEKGVPNFPVKITNNNQQAKTVKLYSNSTALQYPFSVTIPGRTEKEVMLRLDTEKEKSQKIYVYIDTYQIPIFIISAQEPGKLIFYLKSNEAETRISSLQRSIDANTPYIAELLLENTFNATMDFAVALSGELEKIARIETPVITSSFEKKTPLLLYINEQTTPQKDTYQGSIDFSSEAYKISLPVMFIITHSSQPEQPPEPQPEQYEEPKPEELTPEPTQYEDEESNEELQDYEPFNYSKEQEQEQKQTQKPKSGLLIAVIVLLFLLIAIFFVLRKPIKKQSFSEYIEKIKKRKK